MKKRQDPGLSIPGIKNEFDGGCLCVPLPARQLLQSSLLVFLLHHPVLRVAAQGDCTSLLYLSFPNPMVSNATRVVAGPNFTTSMDDTYFAPTWVNPVDTYRVIDVVTTSRLP